MSQFYSINIYIIHFGTGLAFLLAAMKLCRHKKGEPFEPAIFVSLCIGSVVLRFGQYVTGFLHESPFAFFFLVTSIAALGPCLLLLSNRMLDFALPKRRIPLFFHFVPVIILIFFEIYFQTFPHEIKRQVLIIALNQAGINWVNMFIFAVIIHIESYLFYLLYIYSALKKKYDINYDVQAYSMIFFPITGICIAGIGYFMKITILFHIGADLLVIATIFFFMISIQFSDFFETLQNEIRMRRYEITQANGIDHESVKERLRELIEEDKVFLDENIRLTNLAEELLISPHQLSGIINETFDQNFNEFINSYRIEEAIKIIHHERDKTIYAIASEVGYFTQAVFISQFKKFTNMSPTEYREKNSV